MERLISMISATYLFSSLSAGMRRCFGVDIGLEGCVESSRMQRSWGGFIDL